MGGIYRAHEVIRRDYCADSDSVARTTTKKAVNLVWIQLHHVRGPITSFCDNDYEHLDFRSAANFISG